MSKKFLLFVPLLLLTPVVASADCTDLVHHSDNEYDTDWDARAYSEIWSSDMYGGDCTDNPYKYYAKVRVRCDADRLYLYRLSQSAEWSDAKEEIDCGNNDVGSGGGCTGYDRSFSSGEHTVTLRSDTGDVRSAFFVCFDHDEGDDGSWAWTWTGWAYYGNRVVFEPRVTRKCSDGDSYWYDSLDRKGDIYEDCGDNSCDDWGTKYCDGDKIKQDRTCYERGCNNGDCYENVYYETRTVDTCKLGCYNGECLNDKTIGVIDRLLEKIVHLFGFKGWTM